MTGEEAVPASEIISSDCAIWGPSSRGGCGTENILGLMPWLSELNVPQYYPAVNEWAKARGACCLQEIVDDLEDFISDIGFKKLECKRIRKDGASAMDVTLSSLQKPVEVSMD